MIFVLFLSILFFSVGYTIKNILITRKRRLVSVEAKFPHNDSQSDNKKPFSGFFDPTSVSVGEDINKALEEIFDIIIDRYVIFWYRTLSDDSGFLVQVRMYLQFLSAALVYRMKCMDPSEFSLKKVIPSVMAHVEHLCEAFPKTKEKTVDSLFEDTVLRELGPHLHICMASRSSELAYLRALVNRLLPYISRPPALMLLNKSQPEQTSFHFFSNSPSYRYQRALSSRGSRQTSRLPKLGSEHSFQRTSSVGSLFSRQAPWVKLDANRAAYSFLIEILSTCVLLPAMDAVAHPDFINKLILSSMGGDSVDPGFINAEQSTMVPVLNTYVQEWISWMGEKSLSNVRLDNILQQQDDLYPFTQYMKSVRSIEPLTAVLLMNDIDRRVRSEPLPPDTCRELRAQIWHVLALIRGSSRTAMEQDGEEVNVNDDETKGENLGTEGGEKRSQSLLGDEFKSTTSQSRLLVPIADETNPQQRLFDAPMELDDLLIEVIQKPEPHILTQLIRKPLWQNTFQVAKQSIEKRFLPMYVESPEYLCHVLGISQRTVGPCPGSPKPTRSPGCGGTNSSSGPSLFGNSLKNMFSGTHTVEGHLIQDLAFSVNRPQARLSSRPCKPTNRSALLRDRIAEVSGGADQTISLVGSGNGPSGDSQHQLHSHYLQRQSNPVDMSDWNVYIPGLSRPEVQPSRRLIDQLTSTPTVPVSRGMTGTNDSNSFRMRLLDDSNTLNEGKSSGTRTPQLSPQYMFTVRTEHLVDCRRQPVARVDRKYSEFYVLEQKLLEFHGNAIAKQLPRRQFTPKTFEFMDAKREEFEEYLQFLLAQPFLRNSELLYTFLTSKTPFTSSLLSELNLGRLVKSVPLKLTKEDSTVELSLTMTSSLSNASLNSGSRANGSATTVTSNSSVTPVTSSSLSIARPIQCTVLDNRLRARVFWNNASWSADRRKDLFGRVCESKILQWNGMTEAILYFIHQLNTDTNRSCPDSSHSDQSETTQSAEYTADSLQPDQSVNGLVAVRPPTPPDPWDVSHAGWSEAFLNGPLTLDQIHLSVPSDPPPSLVSATPMLEQAIPNQSQTQPNHHHQHQPHEQQNQSAATRISITWFDFYTALVQSGRLLLQHLTVQYRYFILWLCFQIWYYLRVPIDRWLSSYLLGCMQSSWTDSSYAASALQLLKATIFFPYTPSTEAEKRERKAQASALLQRTLLKMGFEYISSRERIEELLDRFLLCFQYPKWNKQLSYILLDHLVIALFPELQNSMELKLETLS
ncbi:Sorting nexin-14 [Fasciola gigantica]|uniref:Sorting nexin-14 n=1 Tax=Fasciola gigantica TaxID=46835 RepID=A0A504Z1U2_FASGI|nr:Sorting nexin-14 [Fasciola gigantica]